MDSTPSLQAGPWTLLRTQRRVVLGTWYHLFVGQHASFCNSTSIIFWGIISPPLYVNLLAISFKVPFRPLLWEKEWSCDPNRANQTFSRGLNLTKVTQRVGGGGGRELKHSFIPVVTPSKNHGLIPTSKNPRNTLVSFFSKPCSPMFFDFMNCLLNTFLFKEARVTPGKPPD